MALSSILAALPEAGSVAAHLVQAIGTLALSDAIIPHDQLIKTFGKKIGSIGQSIVEKCLEKRNFTRIDSSSEIAGPTAEDKAAVATIQQASVDTGVAAQALNTVIPGYQSYVEMAQKIQQFTSTPTGFALGTFGLGFGLYVTITKWPTETEEEHSKSIVMLGLLAIGLLGNAAQGVGTAIGYWVHNRKKIIEDLQTKAGCVQFCSLFLHAIEDFTHSRNATELADGLKKINAILETSFPGKGSLPPELLKKIGQIELMIEQDKNPAEIRDQILKVIPTIKVLTANINPLQGKKVKDLIKILTKQIVTPSGAGEMELNSVVTNRDDNDIPIIQ